MARVMERTDGTCANRARQLRDRPVSVEVSRDAAEFLVEEYARLVEDLLDPRATEMRTEFAYSRLLGTRGCICRLCPPSEMRGLPRHTLQRWRWAETRLRDYLGQRDSLGNLAAIAQRVEAGWADSVERFIMTLASNLNDAAVPDKLGILKAIDTIGLHLAQRELFALADTFAIPLENAHAVKLRVRLVSLFLTLNRCGFYTAFPAIQSYRDTFRIHDRLAYPWWFVDCRLNDRQLNWTYRRLPAEEIDWRF
jgi:hypothetical protein